MKKKIVKYLGVPFFVFSNKENQWVDIKPICKLLEIDYEEEVERLSEDHLKGELKIGPRNRTEIINFKGLRETTHLCVPIGDLSLYLSQIPLANPTPILLEKQRACRDDLASILIKS